MSEANEGATAGPSWWTTRNISTKTSEWFILFEYFSRNANAHGLFRVSLSDGSSARQNVFTYDQLFPAGPAEPGTSKNNSNPFTALCKIIDTIEKQEEGKATEATPAVAPAAPSSSINITCDSEKRNINVIVQSDKLCRPIDFRMTKDHPMQSFFEQVMTYASAAHISLQNITDDIQQLQTVHDDELEKLNSAILKKTQHDEKLQRGTRTLMLEKHRHAHPQS